MLPMEVIVEAEGAIALFYQLEQTSGHNLLNWILATFQRQAPSVIFQTFESMLPVERGFPAEYRSHVLDAVSHIPIMTSLTGLGISAQISFEPLGTYEQLLTGYHYHAMDSAGNQIELPYGGQSMKNESEVRYEYWQAMVNGATNFVGINSAGNIYSVQIPPGAFEDTIKARVTMWGNVAPEWLIAEYGIDTYPSVAPRPIVENVGAELAVLWQAICAEAATQAQAQAGVASNFVYDVGGRPGVTVPGVGWRWIKNA